MSSELLGSIVLKIINAYDWLFFKSLFFRGSHSPFRVFALCTIFVRMPGFEPELLGPHFPKVILMISTFMQFVRNTNKHLKLLQRKIQLDGKREGANASFLRSNLADPCCTEPCQYHSQYQQLMSYCTIFGRNIRNRTGDNVSAVHRASRWSTPPTTPPLPWYFVGLVICVA